MPVRYGYHENVKNALIVATELVKAGIPKDRIVLGFRSEELRKDSEFA